MGHQFAALAFTDTVKRIQEEEHSRIGYARMEQGADYNHQISQREADFLSERDSFYMASVSETGWPYVQHRGGPKGFLRVIDPSTIAYADFSGNKQYISTGNFRNNDRVALIFMDYPNRRRLKILGRVSEIHRDETAVLEALQSDDYPATVERGFKIHVEAYDWNCPQHITPRYTEAQIRTVIKPLQEEIEDLKSRLNGDESEPEWRLP